MSFLYSFISCKKKGEKGLILEGNLILFTTVAHIHLFVLWYAVEELAVNVGVSRSLPKTHFQLGRLQPNQTPMVNQSK